MTTHQDGLPALPATPHEITIYGGGRSSRHFAYLARDVQQIQRAAFEAGKLATQPLPVQGEVPALALHPGPPRNHAYACQKDTTGGPTCKQWCGHQDLCLSTMTYPESYMQLAYEHGKRDALAAQPASPERKPLTPEEIDKIASPYLRRMLGTDRIWVDLMRDYARAIEAATQEPRT